MLSNMVNAGISDVGLIVHANYQSLLDHVGSGKDWDLSRKHGGLRILPPFGVAERGGSGEYRGNMEALAGIYTYLDVYKRQGQHLSRQVPPHPLHAPAAQGESPPLEAGHGPQEEGQA